MKHMVTHTHFLQEYSVKPHDSALVEHHSTKYSFLFCISFLVYLFALFVLCNLSVICQISSSQSRYLLFVSSFLTSVEHILSIYSTYSNIYIHHIQNHLVVEQSICSCSASQFICNTNMDFHLITSLPKQSTETHTKGFSNQKKNLLETALLKVRP